MIKRIQAIQNLLQAGEGVLVTNPANRFYFTGFHSSAGIFFISKNKAVFLIDFRYYEKAKKQIKHCEVHLSERISAQLQELAADLNTLHLEPSFISINQFKNYQKIFENKVVTSDDRFDREINKLRSIKSKSEIQHIKEAQRITDDTFSYILNKIRPGISERDLMLDMEFYLRKQGSEGVSFDFIVVSGKNSSLPHGVPTGKLIEPGDFVTMDFGAIVNGYHSDMTRTVVVSSVSDEQRRIYNTVLEAQNKAFSLIKPDTMCIDVDRVAREYIYESGYTGCFGHGLGHSVGLEIHESPSFNTSDNTILKSGMVLTVEPGIYLEDQYGVRIEDMVEITETGFNNLTHSPKELIIL